MNKKEYTKEELAAARGSLRHAMGINDDNHERMSDLTPAEKQRRLDAIGELGRRAAQDLMKMLNEPESSGAR